MNIAELKPEIEKFYTNIKVINNSRIDCQREYNDQVYQDFVFEINEKLDSIDIDTHTREIFSERFYKTPGSLQWNYYLIFVVEDKISEDLKNKIINNSSYARKYIFSKNEFKSCLEGLYQTSIHQEYFKNHDRIGEVINKLSGANLDCIHSKSKDTPSLDKSIEKIAKGSYYKQVNSKHKDDISGDDPCFQKIKAINIIDYREYPKISMPLEFKQVNLIEGKNACGKTSLLEAIEYYLCKSNRHERKTNPHINIECKLDDSAEFRKIPDNNAIFRNRDKIWYGAVPVLLGNRLIENFNRFNFYNTDAAHVIANDSGTEKIFDALEDIVLGEDFAAITKNMDRYREALRKEIIRYTNEINSIKASNIERKKTIDTVDEASNKFADISQTIKSDLDSLKWKYSENSTIEIENIQEITTKLSKVLSALKLIIEKSNWISEKNLKNIKIEKASINSSNKKIKDLINKEIKLKNNLKSLISNIEKIKIKKKFSMKLEKYYENNAIQEIVGIDDKISGLASQIYILEKVQDDFKKIKSKKSVNMGGTINELLSDNKRNIKKYENESKIISAEIEKYQESISEIGSVIANLKSLGKQYIEITPDADVCPLCNQKHANSDELKRHINKANKSIYEISDLSQLIIKKSLLDKKLSKLKEDEKYLDTLNKILSNLKTAYKDFIYKPNSVKKLVVEIKNYTDSISKHERELERLKIIKNNFKEKGMSEVGYYELIGELDDLDETIKWDNKKARENACVKMDSELTEMEIDKKTNQEELMSIEKSKSEYVHEYKMPNSDELIRHLTSQIDRLSECEEIQKIISQHISVSDTESLSGLIPKIENTLSYIKKSSGEFIGVGKSSELYIKASKDFLSGKDRIKQTNDEKNRLDKAYKALLEIAESITNTNFMNEFFEQYKQDILKIFMAIHSPKEFKNLRIENNTLILTRENNDEADFSTISTGQRSALVLTIFLALNLRLEKGPKILMFDDPIAHIDDLNALSFLDFLREIAIKTKRQIFFATANDDVAFLFKQKFSCLKNEFKIIPLTRMSEEQTVNEVPM